MLNVTALCVVLRCAVMISIVMLRDFMLSASILRFVMLGAIILSVFMLSGIVVSFITLRVVHAGCHYAGHRHAYGFILSAIILTVSMLSVML